MHPDARRRLRIAAADLARVVRLHEPVRDFTLGQVAKIDREQRHLQSGQGRIEDTRRRRTHSEGADQARRHIHRAEAALLEDEPAGDQTVAEHFAEASSHGQVVRSVQRRGGGHMAVVGPQHHLGPGRLLVENPLHVLGHRTVAEDPASLVLAAQLHLGLFHDDHVLPRHRPVLQARPANVLPFALIEAPQKDGEAVGGAVFDFVRGGLVIFVFGPGSQDGEDLRGFVDGFRVHAPQIVEDVRCGEPRALHVEAVKFQLARVGRVLIVVAHPVQQGRHVLGAPPIETEAFVRIDVAAQNIPIDQQRLGPIRFDAEDGEAKLFDQEAEHLHLELLELARAVRGLSHCHDARVLEPSLQRRHA
jgi:hypothetical protein